jgi:type IV pilus assembly protein PilM
MREIFSRSRPGPIGLDVGTENVRLLQLTQVAGNLRVQAAGQWQFPEGLSSPGADPVARASQAGDGIRQLLRKNAFRGRDVISCLRTEQLAIRNVRLPRMHQAELERAMMYEAQERLGFEVTPDRVYYVSAGEIRTGAEAAQEVLLMGVPAQAVQDHVALLEAARLRPRHIDSEPTALLRAYERCMRRIQDEEQMVVVLDIGYSSTRVVVARGQTPLLIKTIDIAGRKFNESVARELNLPYAEAAHIRRRGGAGTDWPVIDAIRPHAEALAGEVGLCLRYCSVTFRGLRPSRLIATGGEAYDVSLLKLLGEQLNCECVLGEPLRGMDLHQAGFDGDRRGTLTEWSVATGLALRDMPCSAQKEAENYETRRIPA